MMVESNERIRTQLEVCEWFNAKYSNITSFSQSTVSKSEKKYHDFDHVRDNYTQGRPAVTYTHINILMASEDWHKATPMARHAATFEPGISQTTVAKYLNKNKWHPYKVKFM